MTIERGTIVYAADPFKDQGDGRPWVIVNTSEMPFHGEQYVGLTLSSKTWYDDRLPIDSEDVIDGDLPVDSSVLPWAVASIDSADVDSVLGVLRESVVDEAVSQLVGYLGIRVGSKIDG